VFGTKEARYGPVRFNWLGSPSSETAMVLLRHQNETDQWISRPERRAACHGAARARWPSECVLQLGALDPAHMAARQDRQGDRAVRAGQARRIARRAIRTRPRRG